ncbi:MAG: N,N-dimethylformamidase beta subunit family domain-containing protein, partial [Gammaproteobacteria bacterium]
AQTITGTLAADGCDWDQSYEITIDPDWSAGFYLLRLQDSDGNTADAFFVVRQEQPAEAMLVLSTSTWNAYNVWGGLSYYTGGCVVSPLYQSHRSLQGVEARR